MIRFCVLQNIFIGKKFDGYSCDRGNCFTIVFVATILHTINPCRVYVLCMNDTRTEKSNHVKQWSIRHQNAFGSLSRGAILSFLARF